MPRIKFKIPDDRKKIAFLYPKFFFHKKNNVCRIKKIFRKKCEKRKVDASPNLKAI